MDKRGYFHLPKRRIYLPTGHVITIAKDRAQRRAELEARAALLTQHRVKPSRFVHPVIEPLFREPLRNGEVRLIPGK